jgi:hypothetical protein
MSFPINLLSTEEILAELKNRKLAEILSYRNEIVRRKEIIESLMLRIEMLQGHKITKSGSSQMRTK